MTLVVESYAYPCKAFPHEALTVGRYGERKFAVRAAQVHYRHHQGGGTRMEEYEELCATAIS